jgi:hypothetical protein
MKRTKVTVTSLAYALSANFHFVKTGPTNYPTIQAVAIAATDDGRARDFDARIFARAAAMPPLKIDPSIPNNETDEIVSQYMQSQLTAVGAPATDGF